MPNDAPRDEGSAIVQARIPNTTIWRLARAQALWSFNAETGTWREQDGERVHTAWPKGRPEGSPIDEYVVEDHADHALQTFKTQHEAIDWAKKNGALPACGSRPAPEPQEKSRSLAGGLACADLAGVEAGEQLKRPTRTIRR